MKKAFNLLLLLFTTAAASFGQFIIKVYKWDIIKMI